jgi:PAS domain S-box-containing protein
VYAALIAFTLIVTATMAYALRDRSRVTRRHWPLANASLRLELEATTAHGLLDEMLASNRHESADGVWRHFDLAEWYAKAMLEGGDRPPDCIPSAINPELRARLQAILPRLAEARAAAQARWEAHRAHGDASAADERCARAQEEVRQLAEGISATLRQSIAGNVDSFVRLQTALIASIVLLAVLLALVFHRHVDEGRQAEQALNESEARYRETMAASLAGIYIADAERFHYVNPAMTRLFGCTAEEMMNELAPPDMVAPEERERLRSSTMRRLSGKPGEPCEIRCRRKDGTLFDAIIWGAPITFRGRDASVGTVIDITDRKRAEDARKESEQRFRLLAQNIPGAIYLCKHNDRYTMLYLNDHVEKLTGFPKEDFLSDRRCLVDLFHPDDSAGIFEKVNRAVSLRQPFELLYRIRHRHGDWRWVEEQGTGVWSKDDRELLYLEGLMTDVTERENHAEQRRRLEERIRQSQKLESLGVLAGGIAHDFNNLLVGVLGHAELARMELPADSPVLKTIGHIERAAQRAADLARQILAVSGKGRFLTEWVDVSALVESMSPTLKAAVSGPAELQMRLGKNLPALRANADQLRQMITHLVDNACDALHGRPGVITVATGGMEADHEYLTETLLDDGLPAGYYVYIEVTDSGEGMDRDTVERVFDPFFTTKFTGRGLGLPAVLGIVRGHKGALRVTSAAGVGTTVRALLPRPATMEENPTSTEGGVEMGSERKRGALTILVADDEEIVRTVAQMALERYGYHVLTADDGEETVRVFRENACDISAVLLDLTMPKVGGEEAFRRIREIRADVPVLLSSGYDEQESTDQFAGQGLAGFVQKPYRPQELIQRLRAVLPP